MINKWVITENGLDIRSLVQRDMIVSDVNDKPRMLKVDDVLIAVDVLVPAVVTRHKSIGR